MQIEYSLLNGSNRYIAIDQQENGKYIKFECIWFCKVENLGDGILCTHNGQQIWICEYHHKHFVKHDAAGVI